MRVEGSFSTAASTDNGVLGKGVPIQQAMYRFCWLVIGMFLAMVDPVFP